MRWTSAFLFRYLHFYVHFNGSLIANHTLLVLAIQRARLYKSGATSAARSGVGRVMKLLNVVQCLKSQKGFGAGCKTTATTEIIHA